MYSLKIVKIQNKCLASICLDIFPTSNYMHEPPLPISQLFGTFAELCDKYHRGVIVDANPNGNGSSKPVISGGKFTKNSAPRQRYMHYLCQQKKKKTHSIFTS